VSSHDAVRGHQLQVTLERIGARHDNFASFTWRGNHSASGEQTRARETRNIEPLTDRAARQRRRGRGR